jgi:hypothetical protein
MLELSADRAAALEASAGWSWSSAVIEAKLVDAAVAAYDTEAAKYEAWETAGSPEADGLATPEKPERIADHWLDQNGGEGGRFWLIAEYDLQENGTPLPAVTAQDLDTLTAVVAFMAENGHSDIEYFDRTVDRGVERSVAGWRREPSSVHPFIRTALNNTENWHWTSKEATFYRGKPYMDAFVLRTGTSIVPLDHMEDGFELGKWMWHNVRYREHNDDSLTGAYLRGLPDWEPNYFDYEEAAANAAWRAFYDENGHAGILSAVDAWRSDLDTKVRRWTNGGHSHHDTPRFPDITLSLPDYPQARGDEGRSEMEITAVRRTLAMFRAREGLTAKLPKDHVEARLPLGALAHYIVAEFRFVERSGQTLRSELVGLWAELEAVVQPGDHSRRM